MMIQIASPIEVMHENDVLHRDICLDNILVFFRYNDVPILKLIHCG